MGYQWYKLYSMATYGNPPKKIEKWKQEGIDDLFLITDSSIFTCKDWYCDRHGKAGSLVRYIVAIQSGKSKLHALIWIFMSYDVHFFNRPCYHQHVWPDSTSKTSFLHRLHWAVMLGFEHKVAPYPMAYSLLESPFFCETGEKLRFGPILDNTRAAFWTTISRRYSRNRQHALGLWGPKDLWHQGRI